jgi:phosphoribosyl 1,2-cyclic phosphodiesterase
VLDVVSLGSGSSGNALLVRTARTAILVDCGLDPRRISSALTGIGLSADSLDAILISHEHTDHVKSLARIATTRTAVVASRGTIRACNLPGLNWTELSTSVRVSVADIEVDAISVSHDAAEPCGFFLRAADGAVTVLTDLGTAPAMAAASIAVSDLVVLEANHDEEMLRRGPYTAHLKRRILSDTGHLSNTACSELLVTALRRSRQLPTVWLAHLSETNNRPQLAKSAVEHRLAREGLKPSVLPLPRRRVGPVWRAADARQRITQLSLPLASANDPSGVDAIRLS